MKRKKIYILIFIWGFGNFLYSQEIENISFKFVFENSTLELNKEFYSNTDSIQFETVQFYISNVTLHSKKETRLIKNYHLIDLENLETYILSFLQNKKSAWDSISFKLGIDSLTNSSGAMGGDLDPTNGMYWTWQSGYINVKIEGKSEQCTARKKQFRFHIGGYQNPYPTITNVGLSLSKKKEITVDFYSLFNAISLKSSHTIMSPSKTAVDFAHLFSSSFKTEE